MQFEAEIVKTDNGVLLRPLFSSDAEEMSKLKQNTKYMFKVSQQRNSKFHRKFMALLNLGYDNQEYYNNFEDYREVMIMRAGFYKATHSPKGTTYKAKSIAFENMDEVEFEELFNKVLDLTADMLESAPPLIKEQLEQYY